MNIGLSISSADPDSFRKINFHDRMMSSISGLWFSLETSVKAVDEDD